MGRGNKSINGLVRIGLSFAYKFFFVERVY